MTGEAPGFADHFSRVAAGYATYRPRYPATLLTWLATAAPSRRLAWDCACGSGQATLGLTPHFDRVIATDRSASQIRQAPPHPKVHYAVAAAEAGGLRGATVSLITVAQALHWLDLDRFYVEARRVLAPDGLLAAWCYGPAHTDDGTVDALVGQYHHGTVGPYWPKGRELVDAAYRTIPFPFNELAAPLFEMTAEWTLPELLGYLRTWSATDRYIAVNGRDPVSDLARPLGRAWGSAQTSKTVHWPLALRVGRVGG